MSREQRGNPKRELEPSKARGPNGTLRGATEVPAIVDVEALARQLRAEPIDLDDVFEDQPPSVPSASEPAQRSKGQRAHQAAATQVRRGSPGPQEGRGRDKVLIAGRHHERGEVVLQEDEARRQAPPRDDADEVFVALPAARPQDPTALSIAAVERPEESETPTVGTRPVRRWGAILILIVIPVALAGIYIAKSRHEPEMADEGGVDRPSESMAAAPFEPAPSNPPKASGSAPASEPPAPIATVNEPSDEPAPSPSPPRRPPATPPPRAQQPRPQPPPTKSDIYGPLYP